VAGHAEETAQPALAGKAGRPGGPRGPLGALYRWVLRWAQTPYGTAALAVIAFCESSFFLLPPDILLIALAILTPRRAFWYALVCTVGSVLGGILGWGIGSFFYEQVGVRIIQSLHYEHYFELVREYYARNAFFYIFTAAFTPIPYKVFTIAAGLFNIPLWTLISASLLGRGGRFFLVAGLLYFFGERVRVFIEKYLNLLTILFILLLAAGLVAIRWLK